MDRDEIMEAIHEMECIDLSENAKRLVNYLLANIDDIEDAMSED